MLYKSWTKTSCRKQPELFTASDRGLGEYNEADSAEAAAVCLDTLLENYVVLRWRLLERFHKNIQQRAVGSLLHLIEPKMKWAVMKYRCPASYAGSGTLLSWGQKDAGREGVKVQAEAWPQACWPRQCE